MSATESVEKNKIIFGPVNSRRFGVSLGVDLSPSLKQCNFDCLYCELAPAATVAKQSQTIEVATIIKALQEHLNGNIDVITLTANGEPTLYPHLSELIDAISTIKGKTQTLILTNSAALSDPNVYRALLKLDQVKLSLDAVSPDIFKKIDRPHKEIDVEKLVNYVIQFSKEYQGKLFIEILFVDGLNNTKEEIAKLNDVLLHVIPKRIDLGTIDRPPAYPVTGISYKELHEIAMLFDTSLPIHIASRVHAEAHHNSYSEEEIINTLDKRPLTKEDIDLLFDTNSKAKLQKLLEDGTITSKKSASLVFYLPASNQKRKRSQ
ncbi:MAG: radical SAM protein [Epsilonproteobacteria bacterium]|nr:radical SAM protein [Campylobacterota bacterium]